MHKTLIIVKEQGILPEERLKEIEEETLKQIDRGLIVHDERSDIQIISVVDMPDGIELMSNETTPETKLEPQLRRLLDYYGDGYTMSENIFDLIDDFTSSDAYSEDYVDYLNNLSERELIEQFEVASTFNYFKIGKYHVLIWG